MQRGLLTCRGDSSPVEVSVRVSEAPKGGHVRCYLHSFSDTPMTQRTVIKQKCGTQIIFRVGFKKSRIFLVYFFLMTSSSSSSEADGVRRLPPLLFLS